MMKKKYVVATLSNGNVALLINMAKNGGIPWDHCFSGETFRHYKPDPESYLGVVKTMYLHRTRYVVLGAQWRPESAQSAACHRLRARPPTGPNQDHLKADALDAVGDSMTSWPRSWLHLSDLISIPPDRRDRARSRSAVFGRPRRSRAEPITVGARR